MAVLYRQRPWFAINVLSHVSDLKKHTVDSILIKLPDKEIQVSVKVGIKELKYCPCTLFPNKPTTELRLHVLDSKSIIEGDRVCLLQPLWHRIKYS